MELLPVAAAKTHLRKSTSREQGWGVSGRSLRELELIGPRQMGFTMSAADRYVTLLPTETRWRSCEIAVIFCVKTNTFVQDTAHFLWNTQESDVNYLTNSIRIWSVIFDPELSCFCSTYWVKTSGLRKLLRAKREIPHYPFCNINLGFLSFLPKVIKKK